MIRKSMGISRSLVAIAVLAAAFGCNSDSAKDPGQQLQSPTSPLAGISITIGASRSRLQVGDDATVAVISVQALRTADWTPLPTGTDAAFAATLGAIDSPSGGRAATIDLVNGKGSITLYPGTTEGTARVSVTIQGVTAVVNVTIDAAGVPGPPAPTASGLSLFCTPSFFDEDDAGPFATTCTAKVAGSDGDPFSGAAIYLVSSSGLGTFSTSSNSIGSSQTTNGAGEVTDTLSVSKADLVAFPGASFSITAHMGVEGGERTATFNVSILTGAPPPAAANLECSASPTTLKDDGSDPAAIVISATVRDQYFDPFAGATVLFSSTPGFPTPSPASDSSDGAGLATSSLDLSAADIANDSILSFTITAKINASSGTVTCSMPINIDHVEDPAPEYVTLTVSESFVLNDGTGEDIDLEAIVQDQLGALFAGGQVTFSSTLGTPSPVVDTSDGSGVAASTLSLTNADITNHLTNSFTVTATLTRPGKTAAVHSQVITIVRPPQADFTFSGASGSFVVNFQDQSTGGPTSWAWNFNSEEDAVTDSTAQNPSAVDFSGATCDDGNGSCDVELTVSNAAGSSSVTKSVALPRP